MPNGHPFSRVMFSLSGVCLVLGLVAGLLMAVDRGQFPAHVTGKFLPGAVILMVGAGFSGILLGIGCTVSRLCFWADRFLNALH